MTIKTNAILKSSGKYFNVYMMNVPVFFASVHSPKKKYQSEAEEYALTAFVDTETRDKLESEFKLNKELFEVGRDKNKKKEVKYKLSTQLKEGEKFSYDDVKGLHGIQLTVDTVDRNGYTHKVVVIDKDGQPFSEDVGNMSICNVKCFAYKNREDMLIVSLDTVQVVEHVPYEGGSNSNGGQVSDDILGVSYVVPQSEKVADAQQLEGSSGNSQAASNGSEVVSNTNAPVQQQNTVQASTDVFDDFDDEWGDVPF